MIINQTKSKRGGVRAGSGRPAGSRTKNSWSQVLAEFELQTGCSFPEQLVKNYLQAHKVQDSHLIYKYDHAIFNKLAPDLHHIEVEVSDIDAKQQEFALALASFKSKTK